MNDRKKLTALVLALLMIIGTVIPTVSVSAESGESAQTGSEAILLGDADLSGEVDIVDSTVMLRYVIKLREMTEDELRAADVDGDGDVTAVDATFIQRWCLYLYVPYPIGEPIDGSSDETSATEATEAAQATEPTEASEVTGDEWKENTGTIVLSDSGITVTGNGAYVDGSTVIITEGGDWEVTGTCSDGMIYVYTGDDKDVNDKVKLRLNGMSLTNPDGPAIYYDRCKKAFITLESGSENYIYDGSTYNATAEEYTAGGATYRVDITAAKGAVHSDDTLEIKGKGSLTVVGSYKHGICSDDDILVENGVFDITSVKDAIHVNDDLTINGKNAEMTLKPAGDGLDSEGTLNLTLLKSLTINGDGKGIKADGDIVITDGTYAVDTADDCINGNTTVSITGGSFDLSSDDEAVTAVTVSVSRTAALISPPQARESNRTRILISRKVYLQ